MRLGKEFTMTEGSRAFGTDLVDFKVITMAMKLRNSLTWHGDIISYHRPFGIVLGDVKVITMAMKQYETV